VLKNEKSRTSNCFFGDITVQSQTSQTTFDKGDGRKEEEIDDQVRIIFRPATWLMRLGLAYELHLAFFQSSRVWKGVFQMYQPVPDDSLIFEFCRTGNIEGVQLLLSRKGASVWDVNSNGWTPLHVSFEPKFSSPIKVITSTKSKADLLRSDFSSPYMDTNWKQPNYYWLNAPIPIPSHIPSSKFPSIRNGFY
jgi:hypothetical protein